MGKFRYDRIFLFISLLCVFLVGVLSLYYHKAPDTVAGDVKKESSRNMLLAANSLLDAYNLYSKAYFTKDNSILDQSINTYNRSLSLLSYHFDREENCVQSVTNEISEIISEMYMVEQALGSRFYKRVTRFNNYAQKCL
jgi:hypothetical protein